VKSLFLTLLTVTALAATVLGAEEKTMKDQSSDQLAPGLERAVIGGGCFWCLEAIFQRLDGVKHVTSGYAGGHTKNPNYEEVCTHTTGHAEVIQIDYDPKKITYEKLLHVFWQAHDPTTLNRQGHDIGDSYRSIILYANEEQKKEAEKSIAEEQSNWKDPIVTQVVPLEAFYKAEVSHQDYYRLNGNKNPYCQIVIRPKVEKLEKKGVIPKE
jgi:peptide-methionine (S)-S-oxide reductase